MGTLQRYKVFIYLFSLYFVFEYTSTQRKLLSKKSTMQEAVEDGRTIARTCHELVQRRILTRYYDRVDTPGNCRVCRKLGRIGYVCGKCGKSFVVYVTKQDAKPRPESYILEPMFVARFLQHGRENPEEVISDSIMMPSGPTPPLHRYIDPSKDVHMYAFAMDMYQEDTPEHRALKRIMLGELMYTPEEAEAIDIWTQALSG